MAKNDLLTIDAKTARELFPSVSGKIKEMLIDKFGESFLSNRITDRIKSFGDICKLSGTTEKAFMDTCKKAGLSSDEICYRQLKLIARVLNEGWSPTWNDTSEKKWFPWFWLNKTKEDRSGFRFHDSAYVYAFASSHGGSRLCFKSKELSDFAGKTFKDIYKGFIK